MALISRGFRGRRQSPDAAGRLPPGQYETRDFPVLSAGPTPQTPLASWDFTLRGADGHTARWTWDEFTALPGQAITEGVQGVPEQPKLAAVRAGDSIDPLLSEPAPPVVNTSPYKPARPMVGYNARVPLAD